MITDATATRTASGTWQFTWTAGTSPYSVWLDGKQLANGLTTESYEYTEPNYPDEAPPLEILEAGDTADNSTYPPLAAIQWRGDQSAIGYEVEQKISGTWTVVATVMERGLGYYSWVSSALADVTTHEFRVTALDLRGNSATVVTTEVHIVRNPAPPSVSVAVSSGDIVVSAA